MHSSAGCALTQRTRYCEGTASKDAVTSIQTEGPTAHEADSALPGCPANPTSPTGGSRTEKWWVWNREMVGLEPKNGGFGTEKWWVWNREISSLLRPGRWREAAPGQASWHTHTYSWHVAQVFLSILENNNIRSPMSDASTATHRRWFAREGDLLLLSDTHNGTPNA